MGARRPYTSRSNRVGLKRLSRRIVDPSASTKPSEGPTTRNNDFHAAKAHKTGLEAIAAAKYYLHNSLTPYIIKMAR